MDAPPLCPSQDIVNGNDKSEPIPHLEDSVRIIMDWSEWRDLNPRPHGPEVLSKIPLDPFGPV